MVRSLCNYIVCRNCLLYPENCFTCKVATFKYYRKMSEIIIREISVIDRVKIENLNIKEEK